MVNPHRDDYCYERDICARDGHRALLELLDVFSRHVAAAELSLSLSLSLSLPPILVLYSPYGQHHPRTAPDTATTHRGDCRHVCHL